MDLSGLLVKYKKIIIISNVEIRFVRLMKINVSLGGIKDETDEPISYF